MSHVFAIGAMGGSGTRAVAQILIQAGVHLGLDLNEAYDNLMFSRLFKNVDWYSTATVKERRDRFLFFKAYMEGVRLSELEISQIKRIAKENTTFTAYPLDVDKLMEQNPPHDLNIAHWGWKEPNSQFYLDDIASAFPDIRYIHVVRHGLDMAFSKNIMQLKNWGFKYGLAITGHENKNQLAVKQLDYWISSTREVMEKASLFGDRFYLLNYSDFCAFPLEQTALLLNYIGLNVNEKELNELSGIVSRPESSDRYKNYDLSIFREDQLEFVRSMGFDIRGTLDKTGIK